MLNSNSTQRIAENASQKPTDQQVNRACEACRLLKVRCLPDETSPSSICQRCKKSGRNCIYAAPQKRRQRIRTDTRVAELEREIRAMRSLLRGGNGSATHSAQNTQEAAVGKPFKLIEESMESGRISPPSLGEGSSSNEGKSLSRQSSIPTSQSRTPEDDTASVATYPSGTDVNEATAYGLLSLQTANELFDSYNNDLVQYYPAVIFPKNSSPDEVRKSKPVLFQAVVTAAASQLDGELCSALFKEIAKVYADRIFIKGEKSLELVQSLIVSAVWYCPPGEAESCGRSNLQFYQYIHMGATMAMDLGLGMHTDISLVSLEGCRTLLSCYLNCAGVAMRMRRPNMLQWTSAMGDCLKVLENSPDATPLDKCLAAWVKLQNIADEWGISVCSIDSHSQLTLRGFERQLEEWKKAAGPDVMNVSLTLAYHHNSIYLHESALEGGSTTILDFNHKVFRPLSSVDAVQPQPKSPLSAAYVSAVIACINSSHALLDEFLALDIQTMRKVPIILYVRMSYASVVLIKLFVTASSPSSELGKILDLQTLKVDYYLKTILERLEEVVEPKKLRVPSKWLSITRQANELYRNHLRLLKRGDKQEHETPRDTGVSGGISGTRTRADALNELSSKSSWNNTSYPIDRSLQGQQFSSGPDGSVLNNPENAAILPDGAELTDTSKYHMAANGSLTYMSLTDPPSLAPAPMADFVPMDFTQDEFSFLNNPGVPAEDFNDWLPDGSMGMGMLGDMSYESPANNNWGFDL